MARVRLYGGLKFKMELPSPDTPVQELPPPENLILPLSDQPEIHCRPLVERGERVYKGERIGEDLNGLMLPIHSPVSGYVSDIRTYRFVRRGNTECLFIASDGQEEWKSDLESVNDFEEAEPVKLAEIIRDAGVKIIPFETFRGGAGQRVRPVKNFVVNGIEHGFLGSIARRLLVERAQDLVEAVHLIKRIFEPEAIHLVINKTHADVVRAVSESGLEDSVRVLKLDVYYPLGHPHLLFKSIFGKEIASPKKKAIDMGAAFSSVDTMLYALEAVKQGKPLIERYVAVSGEGVQSTKILKARIGTPIRDLVSFCGGFKGRPGKVALGNPFDGMAQLALDRPVLKDTRWVWVQPEERAVNGGYRACINCGRCIDVCPMHLMPNFLGKYCEFSKFEDAADQYGLLTCIDCGLCAYVCPSRRPLIHLIAFGKRELAEKEKAHALE